MKRFILLYTLYMVIAFVLTGYEPLVELLKIDYFYTQAVTQISAALISALGIETHVSGIFIHLRHATLEVKFGCNGLEAVLLFIAAVLAYPATAKQKLFGLALGFVVIEFFNIIRIAVLGWVLEYHPSVFDTMHTYITQSIMIVIAFLAFIFYLQKVTPRHAA